MKEPIDNELRLHRRRARLDPGAVCVLCLETDLQVLAPRRIRRHLLEGHHVVLVRNDEELEVVLCLNCHAKIHSGLLLADVDPKETRSGFLERLATVLRAVGVFFSHLGRSVTSWANHLDTLIHALDARFPAWRQLEGAQW